MCCATISLESLPVELLYEIFIHSGSHSFPYTSRHFFSVFKCAPSSVHAEYLRARHVDPQGGMILRSTLLSKVLRYPICSQAVLDSMFRLPFYSYRLADDMGLVELPRRLFRSLSPRSTTPWTAQDQPLPFLRYLFNHPHIPTFNANYSDGYALTRAVASGFVPLVRFLLDQGASPACKDGIAVHAAIRRRNLSLVKLLIEPDSNPIRAGKDAGIDIPDAVRGDGRLSGKRRRRLEDSGEKKSLKKRKLEDRVRVDQEMLRIAVACDARDIVKYFMEEKSVMPDMQTVRKMRI